MAQNREPLDTGDARLDDETPQGGARMAGTPGYESEAAYRHRQKNDYDIEEIRPNQLARSPLREMTDEPTAEPHTLRFSDDVSHESR